MVEHVINPKKLVKKITQNNSIIKFDLKNLVDEKSINFQNSVKLYKFSYVFSVNFLSSTMWQLLLQLLTILENFATTL